MDSQDKKTLQRVWGNGKAYRDLLEANITDGMRLALQGAYRDHGFYGPSWDQKLGMWQIQRFSDGMPGVCRWTVHREHSITAFLDVGTEITNPRWAE